ncbi:MAG TPA: hypothetical protein VGU27_09975 [Candidatus Eisenbacteria bacterium]|nr:hypothetical protein [Candidatus Eisenbacteria bacterium]
MVEAGAVTRQQVEAGLQRQRDSGLRIGETLVELGAATEEDVARALARQLGLTFVDLATPAPDAGLVRSFPEALLRRTAAVPLVRAPAARLTLAVADPTDEAALADLAAAAAAPVEVCVATPSAIRRALDAVFGARVAPSGPAAPAHPCGVVWDRSGATFLEFHVVNAVREGCSEIHALPEAGQIALHYRDGARLRRVAREPAVVLEYLLARIAALGGPVLGTGVHAQGEVRCPLPGGDVVLEVSLLRTDRGIAVTLGPRPPLRGLPTLEALGVEAVEAARLRGALAARAGLVIVCGPRRTGGSTTLAALAAASDLEGARVIAFGPDLAAPIPQATRVPLHAGEARVRWEETAIAQDADVVLLDEVLPGAAIDGVLSAAGSRRLLLARTDWSDSFALLERLLTHPQGRSVLAGRLLAILQQRSVRPAPESPGTSALVEVLFVSDAMRLALREGEDVARLRALAIADGFRPLARIAADRVAAGTLSELEAARALS